MTGLAEFENKVQSIKLSKKNLQIYRYITENYSRTLRMSANEIAEELHISYITVIRFVQKLGYDGYRDFQYDFHRMMEEELQVQEGIRLRPRLYDAETQGIKPEQEVLEGVFRDCQENLQEAKMNNSVETYRRAVEMIGRSHRIYLAGFWKCVPLVEMLSIRLQYLCRDVVPITGNEPREYMKIVGGTQEDCMILFAFHRFPKGVMRLMRQLTEQGIKTILITDDRKAWEGYGSDMVVLCTPKEGDYYSNMVGAEFICEVLTSMAANQLLPLMEERNKEVRELVMDMDYFAEWPSDILFRDKEYMET